MDYIHNRFMYFNTEHYEMHEASKEFHSGAAGLLMRVDRPGTRTIDIENKGKNKTGIFDTDEGIMA